MIDFQKNKLRPGLAVFLLIAPFLLFPQEVPPLSTMLAELALSTIFGEASPASPYAERLRLIHRLPSDLSPEQLARCRAFLESSLAGQPLPVRMAALAAVGDLWLYWPAQAAIARIRNATNEYRSITEIHDEPCGKPPSRPCREFFASLRH